MNSIRKRNIVVVLVVVALFALSVTGAMAQSLDLQVDIDPLFTQIETFFPIFFTIFAIIGGIAAAIVLGKTIINAVVEAFSRGFS